MRTSDHLVVTVAAETLSVSVSISPKLTLGVGSRANELRRRLKSKLGRWAPASRSSSAVSLTGEWSRGDFDKFQNALAELEAVIVAFQKERLEPKVVQDALGITAQEYRRWVKTGVCQDQALGSSERGARFFSTLRTPFRILRHCCNTWTESSSGATRTALGTIDASRRLPHPDRDGSPPGDEKGTRCNAAAVPATVSGTSSSERHWV
jgi:hypothetical protein